jgi:hypothetical protein
MDFLGVFLQAATPSAGADILKSIATVAGIASAIATVGTALFTRTTPWISAKLRSRSLQQRIGAELYPSAGIERSLRFYVQPLCQDVDPAGGDEPRLVYGVTKPLFAALDDVLGRHTEFRHVFLLADSGMGKSSALLNYYARHLKRFRPPYRLALVPLGIPDADQRILSITDKVNTVLLLDALDEDTLAIVDHRERVRLLLDLTRDFQKVLITCRTQFFSREEEIPRRTAILKVGARAAGESGEYLFHKIYLSPFTDQHVKSYLRKVYPVWRLGSRKAAIKMAAKIRHLSARPMLLAHIDDLIRAKKPVVSSAGLYDEMVNAWLKREDGFVRDRAALRNYSELLAVEMYLGRKRRGSERIPKAELDTFAQHWRIDIEEWKLSGRSLLNRDTEGNFKFAHRSIMEFLFVKRFLQGDRRCLDVEWTDQMSSFLAELLQSTTQIPRDFHIMKEAPEVRMMLPNTRTLSSAVTSVYQLWVPRTAMFPISRYPVIIRALFPDAAFFVPTSRSLTEQGPYLLEVPTWDVRNSHLETQPARRISFKPYDGGEGILGISMAYIDHLDAIQELRRVTSPEVDPKLLKRLCFVVIGTPEKAYLLVLLPDDYGFSAGRMLAHMLSIAGQTDRG